jgi:putative transcriptional regulator
MFADALKAVRQNLNMTQEAMAHELQVSFTTINRWENAKSKPNRLAKKFFIDFCIKNNIDKSILDLIDC